MSKASGVADKPYQLCHHKDLVWSFIQDVSSVFHKAPYYQQWSKLDRILAMASYKSPCSVDQKTEVSHCVRRAMIITTLVIISASVFEHLLDILSGNLIPIEALILQMKKSHIGSEITPA